MDKDNLEGLGPTDLVILVMGMTGVGKSSFITRLANREAGIGHGLVSFTTGIGVYSVKIAGRTIYLVDTPGFDGTYCTNVETFKEIAFLLGQIHRNGARLGGIFYLHRITDNRVTGSAVKSFNILKMMCGPAAAKFVTLVTTMWDCIPPGSQLQALALQRERELRDTNIFWGSMFRHGSCMVKWPRDENSPLDYVRALADLAIQDGPVVLQIQRETIDQKRPIENTTVGLELIKEYAGLSRMSRQELQKLRVEYVEAEMSRDYETAKTIEMQKQSLEVRIQEEEAAETSLHGSVEAVFQSKREAYRKLYAEARKEQREIEQGLERFAQDCQRMRDDIDTEWVIWSATTPHEVWRMPIQKATYMFYFIKAFFILRHIKNIYIFL